MFRKVKKTDKNGNKRGIVLAESLVAVATLATGVIILGSVVNSAISTMAVSKNYLIAQNLATEGIESVKNLRDTNWLLEPDDMSCWLRADVSDDCIVQVSADTNYIPKQAAGQWYLASSPNKDDLDIGNSTYSEGYFDDYLLYVDNITSGDIQYDIYVAKDTGNKSIFYRSIKFSEIIDDSATFTVKLQWKEGAKVRTIEWTTTIYNY